MNNETKVTNNKTARKIIAKIEADKGCTSIGLLSCDLQLTTRTIARYVRALMDEGRVQFTWDGLGLELTDSERLDRAEDRAVAELANRCR